MSACGTKSFNAYNMNVPFARRVSCAIVLALVPLAAVRAPFVAAQQDELPDGPGKKILQTSCTSCHELAEVTKFRGFYTKDDWRDVVVTMIKYGAQLKEREADVLVEYLARHLGRKE